MKNKIIISLFTAFIFLGCKTQVTTIKQSTKSTIPIKREFDVRNFN